MIDYLNIKYPIYCLFKSKMCPYSINWSYNEIFNDSNQININAHYNSTVLLIFCKCKFVRLLSWRLMLRDKCSLNNANNMKILFITVVVCEPCRREKYCPCNFLFTNGKEEFPRLMRIFDYAEDNFPRYLIYILLVRFAALRCEV